MKLSMTRQINEEINKRVKVNNMIITTCSHAEGVLSCRPCDGYL